MIRYVVGFMFDPSYEHVALIEKQKPEWMRGTFNGIGGKIEEGETPSQAMIREFEEEAGVRTTAWRWFCYLSLRGASVDFFTCCGDLSKVRTMEEEKISIVPVDDLRDLPPVMPNLFWLLPMAMDKDKVTAVVVDLSR